MRKYILIWVLSSFILSQVLAQATLPPVYAIISDTAKIQRLDSSFWQTLEDKEGKWTLSDVSRLPLSGKFHIKGLKPEDIDTTGIHIFWQRYRLKNTMEHDAKISLTSFVHYFDVFILENDSLTAHFKSGFLRPWNEKDGLRSGGDGTGFGIGPGAIPLVLRPGEEILVYDRRENKGDLSNFRISVRIVNTEKLIQEKYVDYVDGRTSYFAKTHLQESFILGLLLLAIFLNIFFYRIVREKVYLNFALFALFLAINRLWNLSNEYFTWEHPSMVQYVPILGYAWAFIPFFFIQFFRYFLNTRSTYPRWDKFLIGLGVFNILVHALGFISQVFFKKAAFIFYNIIGILPFLLIPLCIIITLFLYARKKDRPIHYLIIGALPLLLVDIMSGLENLGIQSEIIAKIMDNFRLIEVICVSWLVLSFSLILLMRFDLLRKENTQKQIDNERLAKEREIEKNELIQQQKIQLEEDVAERTADLKKSLEELKGTQNQLIQSEKMASLGELTAGIAHEIQNPLNFVNNFSEVNMELLFELKDEIKKGNFEEVNAIADDVISNEEKINHHGKRADSIVKGMLQHSRSSNGQKEPTDINALADEYLRLAYHGLRAKDKSFNATTKTDFDSSIGTINIISQDIGRVILNLITNAFYVVDEKKKSGIADYQPMVSVSTKKLGNTIEIKVEDNGNGIHQKILDKIFQPFFTTKPTGQGTGLGLSLSYDIVKAHGGELKVETKEGEGSTFIIQLPN